MAAAESPNLALGLDFLGLGLPADDLKRNFELIDAAVGEILVGSKTQDFPSINDGAQTTTTVTVTGAALGDFVEAVSVGVDLAGTVLTGYVSAADTVTVVLRNGTGGAVNLASTTLRVRVRKV